MFYVVYTEADGKAYLCEGGIFRTRVEAESDWAMVSECNGVKLDGYSVRDSLDGVNCSCGDVLSSLYGWQLDVLKANGYDVRGYDISAPYDPAEENRRNSKAARVHVRPYIGERLSYGDIPPGLTGWEYAAAYAYGESFYAGPDYKPRAMVESLIGETFAVDEICAEWDEWRVIDSAMTAKELRRIKRAKGRTIASNAPRKSNHVTRFEFYTEDADGFRSIDDIFELNFGPSEAYHVARRLFPHYKGRSFRMMVGYRNGMGVTNWPYSHFRYNHRHYFLSPF